MREYVSECGCAISVIKWGPKVKTAHVKSCAVHKHAQELLNASVSVLKLLDYLEVDRDLPEVAGLLAVIAKMT